jgi:hypothetical protein
MLQSLVACSRTRSLALSRVFYFHRNQHKTHSLSALRLWVVLPPFDLAMIQPLICNLCFHFQAALREESAYFSQHHNSTGFDFCQVNNL